MAKKQKFLILLLLVLFGLVLYLILTSESTGTVSDSEQPAKSGEAARLEAGYRSKAREFFMAFDGLIRSDNFNGENIRELKNKLLDLKVPAKFKELHLKFVLALSKLEDYSGEKDEGKKSDSLKTIGQLKADYGWLNN